MSSAAARSSLARSVRALEESSLRIAFLGTRAWIDRCAPPGPAGGLVPAVFELWPDGDHQAAVDSLHAFAPHVTVLLDPFSLPERQLLDLPGLTLGLLAQRRSHEPSADALTTDALTTLDRLVSFDPQDVGTTVAGAPVWRAVPIPVSDAYFDEVRNRHGAPLAITLGEWTPHREALLVEAKHRFDLLEVLHGVTGAELKELLHEYDVGVHGGAEHGGSFGWQVGIHLAAGHLLVSEPLEPAHGLEPGIDYLQVRSGKDIGRILERSSRFPEMHRGMRIRGRLKAEQYRASRLFARLVQDLRADVAAFGRASPPPSSSPPPPPNGPTVHRRR